MNLLYLVNRFPKLSESFVINEIHELERRGHQVAVFSLREPEIDMQHKEVQDLNATVRYLPDPSIRSALRTPGMWSLGQTVIKRMLHPSSPIHHIGSIYITGHILRFARSLEFEIDHIHGHFVNWPKLSADYVASSLGVSWTTTAHAYGLYSLPNQRLLRLLSDKMDRIVTISEYNRRYLEEEIGTTSPIDVVHMGIDPSKFQPSESVVSNRVLTVARFEEKKGILDGIEAIARIQDEVPNLEYNIIGSGKQEELIRNRIESLGLESTISILGHVSDDRLIQELDEAEIFLLPCVIASDGDRDGIPVALMEAMAMETVPVSTTVSGIPELIDHETNGLLVEPGNVEQLSEMLSRYFDKESEISVSQSAARQRIVEAFNVEKCADELISVFRSCELE